MTLFTEHLCSQTRLVKGRSWVRSLAVTDQSLKTGGSGFPPWRSGLWEQHYDRPASHWSQLGRFCTYIKPRSVY